MINTLEKLRVANSDYLIIHSHFPFSFFSQQLPSLNFTECLHIFRESQRFIIKLYKKVYTMELCQSNAESSH